MLSAAVVSEVRRLFDEGRLSRRAIARRLGVSRGSVNAIANGQRTVCERAADEPPPPTKTSALPRRCRECGGWVYLPCLLCRARAYRRSLEVARLVEAVLRSNSRRWPAGSRLNGP